MMACNKNQALDESMFIKVYQRKLIIVIVGDSKYTTWRKEIYNCLNSSQRARLLDGIG